MDLSRALEIVAGASEEEIREAIQVCAMVGIAPPPLAAAALTLVLHCRETGVFAEWAKTIERAAIHYSAETNEVADRMLQSRTTVVAILRALAGDPDE